jgi:glucose-6-phosphate dehydrogenase assembly protein OpcA
MSSAQSRRIDIDKGEIRTISPDSVMKELSRVWGDISQQVEERSGQIPLRTSILTLMVVARGRPESRIARDTLHQLVEEMPSRVIVIEIAQPDTALDATVTGHCQYLDNGQAACYEVIELRAPVDRISALPSLLVPLELFDVPSFMWWVGGFDFSSAEFQRLASSAERIIIDSSRFESALDALSNYHRFLQGADTACTGTDLNWARSTSWRELIAQSFDHPESLALLEDILRIEAAYDPEAEAQAMLIVSWIASRLNWRLTSVESTAEGISLVLGKPQGGDAQVNLVRQISTGVGLRAVRILAGGRERTTRITVRRRSAELAAVSIETAGMPRQERVVHDPQPRLCDLLGKELLIHTRDHVFDESLDFVAGVVDVLRGADDRG